MQIEPSEWDRELDLRRMIEAYPEEPRYLLSIMQDVQKAYNYLPRFALKMIAEHVQQPFSQVYAMASFYKAFSLVPKGRVVFRVCDGTACHIKNSETLIDQLHKKLGIYPGETSEDGEYSVETVNCLGACALAPVMVVNGKVYGKVLGNKIDGIIKDYGRQSHE